jgi:hypothetical protein
MNLKKARTCYGCRAVNLIVGAPRPCELGFNNDGGYSTKLGMRILKPQEPCYKPLTIPELFEAQDLRSNKERQQ